MFAEVVIHHNAKEVDKLYDYRIPEKLEEKVTVGSCVQVPFGKGNQQKEAYIMRIKQKSDARGIKDILSVSEERAFDERMAELIILMRERYLCSFWDVVHTVVPVGIEHKPEEWVILKQKPETKSALRQKICTILEENGGAMEVTALMQFFDVSIRPQLSALYQDGALVQEFREQCRVKEKTVRIAELLVEPEEAEELAETLRKKRATAQARVLEILASCSGVISTADLAHFAEGSAGAIRALEEKGYLSIQEMPVYRDPYAGKHIPRTTPPALTEEQEAAAEAICQSVNRGGYNGFLLHGVTGSGKTEVFMRAIAEVLKMGRQAILLVPEISLTPQMVNRFIARFGEQVAVFHSRLSLGERYDEWRKMRDGEKSIVIGARSAVFAPFSDIGIIILDEEHEQTYKSETAPRYETHEVARIRAEQNGATLLLASATPSVSHYHQANNGEYTLLELKNRVHQRPMPPVEIIDMRAELEAGNRTVFSRRLTEEIRENLARGEQTILFLNRRGFSTFVSCRSCGYVVRCPHCSISMTYHKFSESMRCHYCGHTIKNPKTCPQCGSKAIRYFGGGTQKVEEEVHELFPGATTIRMDVDTTSGKFGHEQILKQFEEEKIDILIGTQMVTKGLDFDNVTLVGVVSADVMLNLNDYRSGERSFSVLEQVTGRAGRAKKPGRAIVQTYTPEHEALTFMQAHDYQTFYKHEIAVRRALHYPPFCQMVRIMFVGAGETLVPQAARYFARHLEGAKEALSLQILGPAPAAVSKINDKYRWQILIKCENAGHLNPVLVQAEEAFWKNKLYARISVIIDKNPNGV